MTNDHSRDPVRLAQSAADRLQAHDYPRAEFLINQALALDPNCCAALNTLGLLLLRTGREAQGLDAWRRAIALHPTDPNAGFALASAHYSGGRFDEAWATLVELFAKAKFTSNAEIEVRTRAYTLCHQTQEAFAARNHEAARQAVNALRQSVEALTGCAVLVRSEELPHGRQAKIAWEAGTREHVIRLSPSYPRLLQPHLLADQLNRMQMGAQARKAGKTSIFTVPSPAPEPLFTSLLCMDRRYIRRLCAQGSDPAAIALEARDELLKLIGHLYSCPIDLVVESRIHDRLPDLAPAQFLAMARYLCDSPDPADGLNKEHITPPNLIRIGAALNSLLARLHDSLFGGTSPFPLLYLGTEIEPLVLQLWACWQAAAPSLGPGDERRLIDAFADLVGLRETYEWTFLVPADPESPKP
jgi:hypothetical protein